MAIKVLITHESQLEAATRWAVAQYGDRPDAFEVVTNDNPKDEADRLGHGIGIAYNPLDKKP